MKKAIAMKCSQKDWDSIKGRIPEGIRIFLLGKFKKKTYIVLFEDKSITNAPTFDRSSTDEIHETFNAKIFLEACRIETDVYEISKQQINTLNKTRSSEVDKYLKNWFPEAFKNELELRKWYVCKQDKQLFLCLETKEKGRYGFDSEGWYNTNGSNLGFSFDRWELATPQEAETALICEAKKRGFEEGAYCNNSNIHEYKVKNNQLKDGHFKFEKNCLNWHEIDDIWYCVFKDGKFATIIETITKEEAEKILNKKIV